MFKKAVSESCVQGADRSWLAAPIKMDKDIKTMAPCKLADSTLDQHTKFTTQDHYISSVQSQLYQCEKCNKILKTEATYQKHVNKDCAFLWKAEQNKEVIAEKVVASCRMGCMGDSDESGEDDEEDDPEGLGQDEQSDEEEEVQENEAEQQPTEDDCIKAESKGGRGLKLRKNRKDLYNFKIPCSMCSKLICKSYMSEHVSRLHSPKFFACDKCGKSFRTELAYNHHVMAKHSDASPFECKDCKRKLSNRISLRKHIARFHSSPDAEMYKCEMCDKVFMLKEDLKQHLECHNADDSFLCGTCGKGFRKRSALQEHEQIHAVNKSVKCLYCDKRYNTKPSMKRHMMTHTEGKRFLCSICGKLYLRKPSLVKHMIVHTNDRPYKCDQCDKAYRSPNCLRAHKDTHAGFKRWKCIYCNKRFFNEANMYKHRKRHIRAYRHTCDICGKGFIEKQELTSHSKTHLVCK